MAYNASDTTDPWKSYDPTLPMFSDLDSLDEKTGFWIRMTANDTLTVTGSIPDSISIPLIGGWNLAGYPAATQPVADALSSINGSYVKVMMYNASDIADPWKSYDPTLPLFSDLKNIVPGFGYWIRMDANDTWILSK